VSERVIPNDVEELLRDSVHSFEELEVLLLLHREAPRAWTAAAIAGELHLEVPAVMAALIHLADQGLVAQREAGQSASYRYAARTAELAAAVDHLSVSHGQDRLQIALVLSRNAMSRIQRSTLKAFSDAFQLRPGGEKGKKDG